MVRAPDLDWSLPFWHETVEPVSDDSQTKRTTLSFEQLAGLVSDHRPDPAGMIFHVGRCGSTLVTRMLAHDPTLLVFREAETFGALHRGSGRSETLPTFDLERTFLDVLSLSERFAAARGQRLLVKHSSWESFNMDRLAELLPATPFVFMHRDPVEVVESSLDGYPGWAWRIHQPRQELQRWVPWLDRLEPPFNAAAIFASVWAEGAYAALSLPPERLLLVAYTDLIASPEATLKRLSSHLGMEATLDVEAALLELDRYSKAARQGESAYKPGITDAHPSLSPSTAAQVREIVGDLPERLAQRNAARAPSMRL